MCDYSAFLKALEDVGYSDWITACPGATERTDEAKMRIINQSCLPEKHLVHLIRVDTMIHSLI